KTISLSRQLKVSLSALLLTSQITLMRLILPMAAQLVKNYPFVLPTSFIALTVACAKKFESPDYKDIINFTEFKIDSSVATSSDLSKVSIKFCYATYSLNKEVLFGVAYTFLDDNGIQVTKT